MKTKITLLIAFFISFGYLNAQDFSINGINYTVTDPTNNYVAIAQGSCFSGNLDLQSTVENTVDGTTTTYTLTAINKSSFESCNSLLNITIPDSVTALGDQVFSYCRNLQSVVLPNTITTIPKQFLERCYALDNVVIPNTVLSIEQAAFIDCRNLTTVTLSDSLEEIGGLAFSETNIENIDLPNTLKTFGSSAFKSCANLKSIVIPNSVTDIGNNTFQYCAALANVTLPNAIVRTGANTFEGTAIKNITLPSSITRIDHYAFRGCSELENIIIPNTTALSSIGISAFENTSNLESIILPEAVSELSIGVFRGSGLRSFTIPEHINFLGSGVFQNCKNLTNFTFPEHLSVVPQTFLKGCTSLTTVTIPDHYTEIKNSAFENCTKLNNLTLPSSLGASGIGGSVFKGCTTLTEISLPESLSRISASLFENCTSLENIILPEAITTINSNAFDGCTNLKSINFSNNLTTIQSQAFINCTSLRAVLLPLNLGTVGNSAFEGCTDLVQLNIESNVTNLGNNTFKDCTNLSKVTVKWENPLAISETVFEDVAIENIELKIPNNTTSLYQNTAVWQDFGTFIEDDFVPNTNLVINGSAEITPILDNGWTQTSGNWVAQSGAAQDGNNFFFAGANSSAELYQDIDVSSFSGNIDASLQKFYFSVHLKSYSQNSIDKSQAILEYRDSQGKVLSTFDTGLSANTQQWFQFKNTRLAPIGTRTVRIILFSFRAGGSNNDGYADNVIFRNEGLDTVEIPDANFEQYLIEQAIDKDATLNGEIFRKDVINISDLNVSNKNIADLTGIESFTALKTLNATNNNIATIDVTNNQFLETLLISQNQLTDIDLSKNINLKNINLGDNQFTSINLKENINLESLNFRNITISTVDFSTNTKLKELYIDNSELQSLDVSMLSDLEILWCFNNQISVVDISNNSKLESLDCADNLLNILDASNNKKLTKLSVANNDLKYLNVKNDFNTLILEDDFDATGNPNLTCIQVDDATYSETSWRNKVDAQVDFNIKCPEFITIPDANFEAYLESMNLGNGIVGDNLANKDLIEVLTTLNISNKTIADITGIAYFTALTSLNASNNNISSLDLSENSNLEILNLEENQLTSLDISSNLNLENINLVFNSFTTIDLSANTNLKTINVGRNNLTTLNLTENIALESLFCNLNQLTALELSLNTNLISLNCEQNSITYLDMSSNENLTKIICNDNALIGLNVQNGNNNQVLNENFSAFANPNLFCILVDDQPYSEGAWGQIDMQTQFSTECPELVSIPDANFEAYLESINVGNGVVGDFYVNKDLIEALTTLNIEVKSISDLTGIENFTNLKELKASNNNLTQVDLSSNLLLEDLFLETNQLITIDVSKNINLKNINFSNNLLTDINLTTLVDLEAIVLENNQLTTLDFSANTKLILIKFFNNQVKNIDLTKNTALISLDADKNAMVSINLKNNNNSKMTFLSATENPNLTCIKVDDVAFFNAANWVSKDAQTNFYENCPSTTTIPDANFEAYLESIDVGNGVVGDNLVHTEAIAELTTLNIASKNIADVTGLDNFTNLVDLNAKDNNLTQIDISKNVLLEIINLDNNELTNIDFSKNFSLKNINVGDNQISTIDVYFLTELESLQCYKNQLSTINLLSNKKLLAFVANENQLKTVDIRENTALVWIDVEDNLLTSLTIKNGNNSIITQFKAKGNPNLTCIEVDEVSFSETNFTDKDATANFSTDCAPANDLCEDATPLTFGQITPGDINSGSFTNFTDCVAGTIIADVWYTLTVPQTGELSVEGTGLGGLLKFALYDSCASNTAISCGLNLSLTNVTPGTIYYLKVWMEASGSAKSATETGTFTLTANESSVLSVDDFSGENTKLLVYPNPATSNISIELSNNSTIEKVIIYSVLGDKISTQKGLNKSIIKVDVSNLSTGIYFIKVKTENGIVSKKLIIN